MVSLGPLLALLSDSLSIARNLRKNRRGDKRRVMSTVTALGDLLHDTSRWAYPLVIARPPAPAPPRSPGARRSSPWPGTDRQQRRARREPARADPSWHTACRGRGGSGLAMLLLLSLQLAPVHPFGPARLSLGAFRGQPQPPSRNQLVLDVPKHVHVARSRAFHTAGHGNGRLERQ